MRYYDPQQQLLMLLFSQLTEDATTLGEHPEDILAKALSHMPQKAEPNQQIPSELFDSSRTVSERYTWLCQQVDLFHQNEAARRADWRLATEQTGLAVLDALIDEETLPQSLRILRESADQVLLSLQMDDAYVRGIRLTGVRTYGNVGAPVLRSSMELTASLSGQVTLLAMSSAGEVSLEFSGAELVTELYDYSRQADHATVLLPAPLRMAYRLHKLLQKALQPTGLKLTAGETALLPLAIGASLFYGSMESVSMTKQFSHDSGHAILREAESFLPAAVNAILERAQACGDERAQKLLAAMCRGETPNKRALRRFALHCASARGEALCRAILTELTAATAGYLSPPLLGEQGENLPVAKETVDATMKAMGYTGGWPHYRKQQTLQTPRLYCTGGLYPAIAFPKQSVLSLVDCVPFLQSGSFCVHFACGTILLEKGQEAEVFPDSDSAWFAAIGKRRMQQFASGLVLGETDNESGELLTLAETATCAAKSAQLEPLTRQERMRVIHASSRPIWVLLVYWLVCGALCGLAAGLLTQAVRGIAMLFGAGALIAPYTPVMTGLFVGGTVGLSMLILAILGRRKL